ncbi:hypothetical protein MGU_03243 [Metarhizium guizhouense ARSEF 977]|uniref:Uncharacterized protein n=1 Tax=Metarhizium guizhouense (strain ARSEF 977) TaxID=1276136 RepID=A0A0B4H3T1_METGA|nr:hypothetical protein MGU_03243 [Metarhizium guizhouense ARSEF 977]
MDSFEESRNEFLWNSSDTGEVVTILDDEGGPFPLCIQKGEAQQPAQPSEWRQQSEHRPGASRRTTGVGASPSHRYKSTRQPDSSQAPPSTPSTRRASTASGTQVVDLIQGGRQQAKVAKVDDVVMAWVVAVVCGRSRKSPQGVAKPFPPSQASTLEVLDAQTRPEQDISSTPARMHQPRRPQLRDRNRPHWSTLSRGLNIEALSTSADAVFVAQPGSGPASEIETDAGGAGHWPLQRPVWTSTGDMCCPCLNQLARS